MNGNKLTTEKALYKHDPTIHNFNAAERIIPYLLNLTPIKSILDVGCGIGTWLHVANSLGIKKLTGIDGVNLNQRELTIPINDFINTDLSLPINLNQKYDLVLCLEVAEHLPEHAAQILVDTLINHSGLILFSAAIPGQGGQNHLNEQWAEYWQELFEKKGYFASTDIKLKFWDDKTIEWWYRQNMLLFATKDALNSLGLSIAKNIPRLVHPELFNEKLIQINRLSSFINDQVWHPTLKNSFKIFLRSIFK